MSYSVTTFAARIAEELGISTETAYMCGILDLADKKEVPLNRMTAARIVHRALIYMGEFDVKDYQRALALKDIYDCHTCVIHVAQVYMKGIMEPTQPEIFGMQKEVASEEAEDIVKKMMNPQMRLIIV